MAIAEHGHRYPCDDVGAVNEPVGLRPEPRIVSLLKSRATGARHAVGVDRPRLGALRGYGLRGERRQRCAETVAGDEEWLARLHAELRRTCDPRRCAFGCSLKAFMDAG